jgi:hypothetical protein
MKIQAIEDFARPQDVAALRGVMSRLVTRFPENGEILDIIKSEYRAGRPLPAVEKAVAARIETGEALPHTLAKAQRDHLRKIRGGWKITKSTLRAPPVGGGAVAPWNRARRGGKCEAIADELGIKLTSVADLTRKLYQTFGVHSAAELGAKIWLAGDRA